jgi:hypothetical protein
VAVPLALDDQPSPEWAPWLYSRPANEWTDDFVGIDLRTAEKIGRRVLRAFADLAAITPTGP